MERLENLEFNERLNDLIISGGSVPEGKIGENTTMVVVDALKINMQYELPASSIVSAYRVGRPPAPQQPDILNPIF